MPDPSAHAPLIEAVKVSGAQTKPGEVTYRVLDPDPERDAPAKPVSTLRPAAKSGDKRGEARLRSGKILDRDNKFLIDCQIHNRSAHGARLILVAKIKVPRRFRLFSDIDGELAEAVVAWQRGQNIGATFSKEKPAALTAAEITALRKKIYVV
ncbi:MAG: hypothetical protein AB1508_13780 [Pseudomonadota bacterium]